VARQSAARQSDKLPLHPVERELLEAIALAASNGLAVTMLQEGECSVRDTVFDSTRVHVERIGPREIAAARHRSAIAIMIVDMVRELTQ
jgi:hypothetical protein